uniref:Uncharacterized protein n=1 Tax=Rhizophora mucronata TaxID=61149 RepID=A0A2P2KT45_RHIMU
MFPSNLHTWQTWQRDSSFPYR